MELARTCAKRGCESLLVRRFVLRRSAHLIASFRRRGLLYVLKKCMMGSAAKMLLELYDAHAAKCALIGEGMKRHPRRDSTAICGTTETPVPAATMARIVVNWPLSKTTLGSDRARPHTESVLSPKRWPSFGNRNGSFSTCLRCTHQANEMRQFRRQKSFLHRIPRP